MMGTETDRLNQLLLLQLTRHLHTVTRLRNGTDGVRMLAPQRIGAASRCVSAGD